MADFPTNDTFSNIFFFPRQINRNLGLASRGLIQLEIHFSTQSLYVFPSLPSLRINFFPQSISGQSVCGVIWSRLQYIRRNTQLSLWSLLPAWFQVFWLALNYETLVCEKYYVSSTFTDKFFGVCNIPEHQILNVILGQNQIILGPKVVIHSQDKWERYKKGKFTILIPSTDTTIALSQGYENVYHKKSNRSLKTSFLQHE